MQCFFFVSLKYELLFNRLKRILAAVVWNGDARLQRSSIRRSVCRGQRSAVAHLQMVQNARLVTGTHKN